MTLRVSFASPRSARFQEASKSALSRRAIAQGIEIGLLSRVLHPNDVAFQFPILRGLCHAFHARITQSRKRALILRDESRALGRSQKLRRESGRKSGVFLIQFPELRFVGFRQFRARVDELVVMKFDQAAVLGVQLEGIPLFENRTHTLKQL